MGLLSFSPAIESRVPLSPKQPRQNARQQSFISEEDDEGDEEEEAVGDTREGLRT